MIVGKLSKPKKLQERKTFFWFDDSFPLIVHGEPEMLCLLPEWVDRCAEVIPFVTVSKSGRDLSKQVWG